MNASSTWEDQGLFPLEAGLHLPDYPGSQDKGDFGFDSISINSADSNQVHQASQNVAAISGKDYYLGTIGLSDSYQSNRSHSNYSRIPTFLEVIKAQGNIQSLSYAYSAGARYSKNTSVCGRTTI